MSNAYSSHANLEILPVINHLVEHIRVFPSVRKIILYGSRAKGTHHAISDIDIAVAGVMNPAEWTHIRRLANVEDSPLRTLLKIDLVQLERVDPLLQESIRKEGQVLYERH